MKMKKSLVVGTEGAVDVFWGTKFTSANVSAGTLASSPAERYSATRLFFIFIVITSDSISSAVKMKKSLVALYLSAGLLASVPALTFAEVNFVPQNILHFHCYYLW
jgi:hypothetical protein